VTDHLGSGSERPPVPPPGAPGAPPPHAPGSPPPGAPGSPPGAPGSPPGAPGSPPANVPGSPPRAWPASGGPPPPGPGWAPHGGPSPSGPPAARPVGAPVGAAGGGPGGGPPWGTVPPDGDPPFSEPVDRRDRSAQGAFRVPFSVGDGFVTLIAFVVGQLAAGLVFGLLLIATGGDVADAPLALIGLGGQILGFALALGYLRARGRLTWRLLGPVRPSWLMVALGLGVGVVGTIGAYALNATLVTLVGAEDPVEQDLLNEVLAGGSGTVLALLVAVVMAPLVEETLFRGVLFQALRRRLGLWPGALLSALVFTVIHVEIVFSQPVALAGLFSLGVFLAWAFHRTGSLLVPILGHAVFNGVSVLLAFLADRFIDLV
jgi:membrane protease YdiL (CAAX protease family)